MNIWSISIQNIKSKPLYTFLSVFIASLSIALLLGTQQLKRSFENQIENNLGNIDVVVGAKGSPLQLVLASVLHLDNSTGNISYKEALKMSKNPLIKSAVPISYGDNYKGYRIVGTTQEYIALYDGELKKGHLVENAMEVILGNSVAQKLNLKIGDTLLSAHGLAENSIEDHDELLTVVGILKPTKKVIDRLIITNLESIWNVHNHKSES
jgi:putative ABC transport system permease protein